MFGGHASKRETEQYLLTRIVARVAVLECLTTATLALYIANARNDPTFALAEAMLEAIRKDAVDGLSQHSPPVQEEGKAYLDALISKMASGLPLMRGHGESRSH